MPRNTREWALRELQYGANSLDWTVTHLSSVAKTYDELHPEISNPLLEVVIICKELQNMILKIRSSF